MNSEITEFTYDGDGNLVKKEKPDELCTIYVGSVYEVEKATCGGAVTHTTTYYPAGGAMRVDSTLYFVLKDHLGSASVLTDASGNLVDEQRYFPYGESRLVGDNMLTDRLFTGQREMAELGIYHYGARFYDPLLMRFIQPDTLIPNPADPQMLNRYSYVGNSPLNYSDPSGNTRLDLIRALITANGKHAWREGGVGKYWNRNGKLLKLTGEDASNTTDTSTVGTISVCKLFNCDPTVNILTSGLSLSGTTTTVPTASVTLAKLTGGGGGTTASSSSSIWDQITALYDPDAILWGVSLSGSEPGLYNVGGLEEIVMFSDFTRATYNYAGQGSSVGIGASVAAYGGVVFNLEDPNYYTGPFGSAGFTVSILDVGITAFYFWDTSKRPLSAGNTQGIAVGYAPGAQTSVWWSTTTTYTQTWRSDR